KADSQTARKAKSRPAGYAGPLRIALRELRTFLLRLRKYPFAERKHRNGRPLTESAFGMDGPHGLLQTIAPHHDGDGYFAGPLRDRDDVHLNAADGRKDAAGETRLALHPFP